MSGEPHPHVQYVSGARPVLSSETRNPGPNQRDRSPVVSFSPVTARSTEGGSMAAAKTARKATTPRKKPGPRHMTASHKKALARGRELSATVDRYLQAINTPKRRGRKVSLATLQKRLKAAQETARSGSGVAKVLAAQDVRDLKAKIAESTAPGTVDVKTLEANFVKIAKQFSTQRSITYGAWRDAGVSAAVLQKAGIARTRE